MRRWTAVTWPIAAVAAVAQACDGRPFCPRPPGSLVGDGEPEHRMIGRNPTQVAFLGIASTGAEDVQRPASRRHGEVATKDARSILGRKLQGADRSANPSGHCIPSRRHGAGPRQLELPLVWPDRVVVNARVGLSFVQAAARLGMTVRDVKRLAGRQS
jgi:hypothetical protein